jgi:predicted Zn-dependent protease
MAMKQFGFSDAECYLIAQRAYEMALQGAYEPAAVLLEGLQAVDPADRYSLLTLAAVRIKQKRAAEAVALLEGWLSSEPGDLEARCLLLESYMEAGRRPAAEQEQQRLEASGATLPARLELRWKAFLQRGDGSLMIR